jgi:hypothetical protein
LSGRKIDSKPVACLAEICMLIGASFSFQSGALDRRLGFSDGDAND